MEVDREKMKCGREGRREAGAPVLEPTLLAGGTVGGTGRWRDARREVGVSLPPSLPIKDAALCCEVLSPASFPVPTYAERRGVERSGAAPIISRDSPPQPTAGTA